jgi:hypothetical protein
MEVVTFVQFVEIVPQENIMAQQVATVVKAFFAGVSGKITLTLAGKIYKNNNNNNLPYQIMCLMLPNLFTNLLSLKLACGNL